MKLISKAGHWLIKILASVFVWMVIAALLILLIPITVIDWIKGTITRRKEPRRMCKFAATGGQPKEYENPLAHLFDARIEFDENRVLKDRVLARVAAKHGLKDFGGAPTVWDLIEEAVETTLEELKRGQSKAKEDKK